MGTYRLYFKARALIVARQDFETDGDAGAQRLAAALFDACSDTCDTIDLWQGPRHITLELPGRGTGFDGLSAVHQEIVVRTEEMIVRSEWALAASRRLIEQLERTKGRRIS